MANPTQAIAQQIPSVNGGQVWNYIGYSLIVVILILFGLMLYYWFSFKIRINVFPVNSRGNNSLVVSRHRVVKVKWIKHKTAWRSQFPLLNRRNIEPLDAKYIYPGNEAYVFEVDGEWVPADICIDKSGSDFEGKINPVPYFVRNWQATEFRNNEQEYARQDWWAENKAWVVGVIMFAICAGMLVGATYLIGKYWMPVQSDVASIAQAAKSITTAQGIGPH